MRHKKKSVTVFKGASVMEAIAMINIALSVLFTLCYLYQAVYLVVPFFMKRREKRGGEAAHPVVMHRFAVLISARNEERVIGHLVQSIREQNYPAELVTVFVVADNCTDQTAEAAEAAGAVVYRRFDKKRVGKGYALDFLLEQIQRDYPQDVFDGFFVFDADNILDVNYIAEMNHTFSQGHRIITSYRNSKNYGENWISAGYSLWFLRESRFLNYPRMLLGTSCAVSGTGFLVHREIIEKTGGWKFFLLTEDIEFSVSSVIEGERIAFCKDAVLYDEQPTSFRQSWLQRLRWAKGFYQVFRKYGGTLFKSMFKRRSFACFDLLMIIVPSILLSVFGVMCSVIAAVVGSALGVDVSPAVTALTATAVNGYLLLFFVGAVTLVSEWRQIHCSPARKIATLFTFPFFQFTYVPIALVALVSHVEWKPIIHKEVKTLAEIRGEVRKVG
jgi:cellulose synthase/poly-beta-1,6-N-acetylglucosamine synthase-like glycosyltransferase